jgi:hypothetical protein
MPDFAPLPPAIARLQAKRVTALRMAPSMTTTGFKSPFATALARAQTARMQPYISPLKKQQQREAAAALARQQVAASRPPPTSSTSSTTSLSKPVVVTRPTTPAKSAPAAALEQPQATTATTQTPTADLSQAMALSAYPRPNGDNGRGMHWIPTTQQSTAVVDRFVSEAQKMGVKWITFLNDGANIGQNDYLVDKLKGAGIEPIMRLWTNKLDPIKGDIGAMVKHYLAKGVHYFQPYNEPNLCAEQNDGQPSVTHYLDAWIPAAKAIVRAGGLVGFGSMAPGGDRDDQAFLIDALKELKGRGADNLLNHGWLSMHNYTHNRPLVEREDSDGFFKFRAYRRWINEALGRDIPIIGTEGGTFVGQQEDKTLPAVSVTKAVQMSRDAYTYMRDQREPWNFAYSYWVVANEAGGGTDQSFRAHALFHQDGTVNPIVDALKALK